MVGWTGECSCGGEVDLMHCRQIAGRRDFLTRMASRFDDDDEVMRFEVTEEDLAEEAGGFMGAGRGRGRQSREQVFHYLE